MNWMECKVIERVAGRSSGYPVIRASRVRPEDLVSNLDLNADELAEEFDLKREDVTEVLTFWHEHAGARAPDS